MASQKIVMHFPEWLIDQPIISRLSKQYNLEFNIVKAQVQPHREGLMVLELSGEAERLKAGLDYVARLGVRIQPLEQDIVRDEALCTHCGVCTATCPVGALAINRETWEVVFDADKCIGCELCVPICPPKAMKVSFHKEITPV